MIELLIEKLHDPRFLASMLAAIAAMATVITLAMPLLVRNDLTRRMNAVSVEREKMRQRERERLARGDKVQLRQTPKQFEPLLAAAADTAGKCAAVSFIDDDELGTFINEIVGPARLDEVGGDDREAMPVENRNSQRQITFQTLDGAA